MAKQYYEPEAIRYGNAIIRVHLPILTEEEEAKRQENNREAFRIFFKKVLRQKENHSQEKN